MRKNISHAAYGPIKHQKHTMRPTHTYKLDHTDGQSGATVYNVRPKLTPKSKLLISTSTLVVSALLFGAGLKLGHITTQHQRAHAGGTETLGVSAADFNTNDETWLVPSALSNLPETNLFSIEGLVLGSTFARIAWNPATDEANDHSPFPRNGLYRITYTATPENATSWQPVAVTPLGTGQRIEFVPANGTTPTYWDAPGYDYMHTTTSILPADAKLGATYYFRAELQATNGRWAPVDTTTAKLTVPQVVISPLSTPNYTAGATWTNDIKAPQFTTVNPVIKVQWQGNGDDNFSAPHTYLYVADNQTMTNKQLATTILTASSKYAVAQQPNTTRYYAVYDGKGTLLSTIFELKTPTL